MATAVGQRAPGASKAVFAALLVYFLPFTFSEDVLYVVELTTRTPLRPVWLPIFDGILLVLLYLLTRLVWQQNIRVGRRHRVTWLTAAGGTVVLDLVRALVVVPSYGRGFDEIPARLELVTSTVYVALMAVLVAATLAVTPPEALRRRGEGWADFSTTIPLLVGVLVGYLAAILWESRLGEGALREDCDLEIGPVPVSWCNGAIDPEYFAQLSQIIPLLLIGVGLESSFFKRAVRSGAQRAGLALMVLVLFLGEVLALSALVRSNQGAPADVLAAAHEYFAFVFVVQAAAVGLAALAWALVAGTTSEEVDLRR